jgi:hypothetical protein
MTFRMKSQSATLSLVIPAVSGLHLAPPQPPPSKDIPIQTASNASSGCSWSEVEFAGEGGERL